MPQGGAPEPVRCDGSLAAAISRDNSTLYFFRYPQSTNGEIGTEILKATPPDGKAEHLTSVRASRVSVSVAGMLSKDDSELAMPLIDGQTGNVWALSTADGSMRPLTDFGDRSVLIARRVAWSSDNRFIYAAVADVDADIFVIRGLWPGVPQR